MLRWDRVEVDEAKADEEQEGKEGGEEGQEEEKAESEKFWAKEWKRRSEEDDLQKKTS